MTTDYTLLYVATDLESFPATPDWHLADDFRFCGKLFRNLDAAYYCWLRSRMEHAHKAFQRRKLPQPAWDVLRTRFEIVHRWGIEHIGLDALNAAHLSFDARAYVQPDNTREAA